MSAPDDSPDKTEAKNVKDRVREAWMGVLGIFTNAEHKMMESLGLNPDQPFGAELLARMRKNRDELERRVDEGVKTAIARVRAPIDKEIAAMRARVEKIQAKIDERKRKNKEQK
jgi:hypothetical protein